MLVRTPLRRVVFLVILWWTLAVCGVAQMPSSGAGSLDPRKIVPTARQQIGVTFGYDAEYHVLPYPGGDVPMATGVCTDVVTRALRQQGFDLQRAVHEDMKAHFAEYPHQWGLKAPDTNIDHRRVPNLMTYFKRQGWAQPITSQGSDFHPGDVVTWTLGGGTTHIGIVSDTPGQNAPQVIHNIGQGAREEDVLFAFKIIGHYRLAKEGK